MACAVCLAMSLCNCDMTGLLHGPLTRYVKLRVAHAPGMRGAFSPPPPRKKLVIDPGIHHDTCVSHVPWCMSESLTLGDGENVPGIPSACTTCYFKYLSRGRWDISCRGVLPRSWCPRHWHTSSLPCYVPYWRFGWYPTNGVSHHWCEMSVINCGSIQLAIYRRACVQWLSS